MGQSISLQIETRGADETRDVASTLARGVRDPVRIGLIGGLGAGKTVFVQGFAEGMDVRQPVTSPTFVLMKSYSGRLPLHHCDWYRLQSCEDVESSGFDDPAFNQGVILVEWADRFPGMLEEPWIEVRLFFVEDEKRRLEFRVAGQSRRLSRWLKDSLQLIQSV